ncbi:unnamed protein product [Arabidopsis thaliana]|uniref:(thale cress) hypothetical protein n=1 Tax=Arabidopsis thaliana TaxID=3702 RepID=A0A7G2EMX5_ARATH|nr:unnamed protein product [Arabidopsis thaliana]
MFPRSPKADEERRRKAKISAQGFALAYRNSFRNEPAPMEAEEQQHSVEHHHHSPEFTQQTSEDPPPLIRRSSRQRTERAAHTRSAGRVPEPSMEEQLRNKARERRRAEIARGKRAVVEEEDVQADDPMYEEPVEEEQVVEEEMMEEEDVLIPKAVSKKGKKTPSTKKNGENINFYPPIHALYDVPENIPPPRQEPPHPGYNETDKQPQDEASEYFPERFHFDPYVATRQSRSERAAHQRVGMLQGLAKFHGKVIKGLTKKVESLTHAVKEMGLQIKELQRKHKSPPPSSERDRVVRRSDSTSMADRFERSGNPGEPSQGTSFEPSRASSYEPREASATKHRKKVKTKRRNAPPGRAEHFGEGNLGLPINRPLMFLPKIS